MRGQILFVRPIEPADSAAVSQFLAKHAKGESAPATGLIGKLIGELVAVMAIDLSSPQALRIVNLVVAPEFRRKRVGRSMIHETELLAAKMERNRLVVEPAIEGREFLRKVGFVETEGGMVRRVGR